MLSTNYAVAEQKGEDPYEHVIFFLSYTQESERYELSDFEQKSHNWNTNHNDFFWVSLQKVKKTWKKQRKHLEIFEIEISTVKVFWDNDENKWLFMDEFWIAIEWIYFNLKNC